VNPAVGFWVARDLASTFGELEIDAAGVEARARRRLGALLTHVAGSNAFYRQRLQDAGIEPADPILRLDPYRALAALPTVTKQELRQAGDLVLDRGRLNSGWLSSASSGSTGEPFRVYYEPRAWARLKYLVKLRARRACGVRITDRIALLDAAPPRSSFRLARWSRISVLQSPARMAAAIASFSPDVLYGLPSALLEAARVLQLRGDQLHIRAVFTSGELFHRGVREALVRAYGAPAFNVYGSSETKEIAWECSDGGMHLNADVVRLEVLDGAGRPLPAGVEGDLVATVLVNRAMPLLRYRTGDRGSLSARPCSCGRSAPVMGVVTGREADVLVLRGGHRVSPYALTCALERITGVLRYQVSQLGPARVRIRAMLDAAADRQLIAQQMRDALRRDVAPFLDAEVEFVDQFPATARAKFRVVEPLGVAPLMEVS
jgi:phenylacetate-CoA ligase